MSDVVSGLLARLDELERVATAAARVPPEHRRGSYRQAPGRTVSMPARAWTDYVDSMEPSDALRLCQAHRDIVKRFQWAWGRRNTGSNDEQALRQMYVIAMIDVLSDLARGLGVETPPASETVIQFTGTPSNFDEVCKFLGDQQHGHREEGYGPDAHMLIYAPEGEVRVGVDDWIARRDDGSGFDVLSDEALTRGLGVEDKEN